MTTNNDLALRPEGKKDLFSLAPTSLQEAMQYADMIAGSNLVPAGFKGKPADVLVAVQMGAEVGLPPTQALQNIAVINGRPSLWGDAVLAICRRSSVCEYIKEWTEGDVAYCEAKRTDDPNPVLRSFSTADAKLAGLLGKSGPWTNYPARMRQMRARGFSLRDAFPDVLRGLRVAEEEQDRERLEKEVNPAPEAVPATSKAGSATAALTSRLKARKAPSETQAAGLELILRAVAQAETIPDLKQAIAEVAAGTSGLNEEQIAQVQAAYNERGRAIKDAEEIPDCDPETGEVVN